MDAQGPPTLRTTGRSGTRKPGPGETQSIMRAAVTEVCDYSCYRVTAAGHQLRATQGSLMHANVFGALKALKRRVERISAR
jgi:hypothetical protein